MKKHMCSRDRLESLINKGAVDQIPVAFWRHFPVDDQAPEKLAKATIDYQNIFNFDLVKVSPSSSFCLKDWGVKDEWRGDTEGTRDYLKPVIYRPEDWEKLPVLNPNAGFLGKQLECLKLIKKEIGSDVPILQTIFNPLAQAKNLIGKGNLYAHMRAYPDDLKKGLKTITESTLLFIAECRKLGIDGLFYAVQHASYDILNPTEFEEFGKSYDKEIFSYLEDFRLNLAHIHGRNIMYQKVTDYPMQIFNWHDRETIPDLQTGQKIFNKVVCGGLSRLETMVLADGKQVKKEIDDAVKQTSGRQFILGTGCVLPLTTPYGNIKTAIDYVRSIKL